MKSMEKLAVLIAVAGAVMALAGSAPATELTSPGGTKLKEGNVIHFSQYVGITIDTVTNITCNRAIINGTITNAGGPGATVTASTNVVSFEECGNHTVTVKNGGSLEIHKTAANTGELRSSGAEITVLTHGIFIGTRHCIFVTNGNHIGSLRGSLHVGHTNATLSVDSVPIGQSSTDSLCTNDAELTGTYILSSPTHVFVD